MVKRGNKCDCPVKGVGAEIGVVVPEEKREVARIPGHGFESAHGSPKLNGRVERANRTYREAFYNCSEATPTVAGFPADLLNWEHTYNHIRPHQALGHLPPAQFLETFHTTSTQEDPSQTS